ncbi:glycosyl hydrolase family 18 protein [uncultured Tenacibaculum sp.]|uniref:glycosyl hydrolase family 18 protein n=1 Tax=uncultured Tenacibaculum sp. TaxID=174713 RepID=UPI0026068BE3|nr:glycosyl hydrolase family 18 protein [uncultured Tenacibaculum sp.]
MKKKVVGYFSNWITLADIESKYEGYTDLLFSFWQDPKKGVIGAAEAVVNNPEIISFLKSKNKKCILAAGGEYLNPLNFDPKIYGYNLANFAIQHQFNGVDLDIENIIMDSQTIQWLVDVTIAVNKTSMEKNYPLQISHAPQAPYFMFNGGYSEIERKTNGIIDYYNIQYYNQGNWEYQSYENYNSLFETQYNAVLNPTSILSITKQNVPSHKLILGKPITPEDVNNTGYIPTEKLEAILSKAIDNKIEFGGIMGWKVDSDINGEWGLAMSKTLQNSKVNISI